MSYYNYTCDVSTAYEQVPKSQFQYIEYYGTKEAQHKARVKVSR